MREAIPQSNWMGFSGGSKSFSRSPFPFFSIKMKILGHLGIKIPAIYYGDKMTWGDLGSLRIPWGNNTTILYDELKPRYTYRWEVGTWLFTVSDDIGNSTTRTVKTISDLGITWDIFESHQFSINLTGKYENDAFLIGWYYKKSYPENPDDPYDPDDPEHKEPPQRFGDIAEIEWSFVEKYLNDTMHAEFGRLLNRLETSATDDAIVDIDITGCFRKVILAQIADLASSGNYPSNFKVEELNGIGTKKLIDRQAETMAIKSLLMIRLFASISDGSKPVFEPWMLWHLWQWFGSGKVIVKRDRVFDLSPWWG